MVHKGTRYRRIARLGVDMEGVSNRRIPARDSCRPFLHDPLVLRLDTGPHGQDRRTRIKGITSTGRSDKLNRVEAGRMVLDSRRPLAVDSVVSGFSRKTHRVHIEHHGHILRQRGAREHRLHMPRERAGAQGAQRDLEAELAVGADQRRWQHLAERDSARKILGKTQVQGLQRELGAALVIRSGC